MIKGLNIVCISDTHELHRELDIPDGDILIHAGDFTMFSRSTDAIRDFDDWLGELPHRHKIVTYGNHEFAFEDPARRPEIRNATILLNEAIEVLGLNIWGSPTTPLHGGAFGMSSPADRKSLYAGIPQETDIIVTHGPPLGILDCAPGSPHHAGCNELLAAVLRVKPRLHLFGHVHAAHGRLSTEDTLYVNAALLGPDGDLESQPVRLWFPWLGTVSNGSPGTKD